MLSCLRKSIPSKRWNPVLYTQRPKKGSAQHYFPRRTILAPLLTAMNISNHDMFIVVIISQLPLFLMNHFYIWLTDAISSAPYLLYHKHTTHTTYIKEEFDKKRPPLGGFKGFYIYSTVKDPAGQQHIIMKPAAGVIFPCEAKLFLSDLRFLSFLEYDIIITP